MLLFGARSPLVEDYLETCRRRGIVVDGVVEVDEKPARVRDKGLLLDLRAAVERYPGAPVIACAFDVQRRASLVKLAMANGFVAAEALVDPTAITASTTRIGPGSYLNAGVVFGAMTRLGDHVLVNRSVSLGHHVVIEDFVSIGPGVVMASSVHVGEGAVLGAGVTVLPGISIGAGAVVAAGSIVRRVVPDHCIAFGMPLRVKPIGTRRFMATDDHE